jgi:T5SS/PEP-CTERM-associated repeat protein
LSTISKYQGYGVGLIDASQNPLTITNTGTLAPPGANELGVYGTGTFPWTIINFGLITAKGAGAIGIYLLGDGSITNQASGAIRANPTSGVGIVFEGGGAVTNQMTATIAGNLGIYAAHSAATVVNAGTIAGNPTVGVGIELNAGGSVTNQTSGTISGADGVFANTIAAAVVNAGSISGGYDAVLLKAGGTVSNQSGGSLYGVGYGVKTLGTIASTVTNQGRIVGKTSAGVDLATGGTVSNLSGGSITGASYGVVTAGTLASVVTNQGGIVGQTRIGVDLATGGTVSNQSGGTIIGATYGALTGGTIASPVTNQGLIVGQTDAGVGMAPGGTLSNQSGGTITGATYGVKTTGTTASTVTNQGVIIGQTKDGVAVFGGGTVSNQSGGTINGATFGVRTTGAIAATVTNQGVIIGETKDGIGVASGGTISNAGSGVITGGAYGIDAYTDAATIINLGTVTAQSRAGVVLFAGGSVSNAASGTITGGAYGVAATNTTATVANQGDIAGPGNIGVLFDDGGYVSNASIGTITGAYYGVKIAGTNASVTNFGRISGTLTNIGTKGFEPIGVDLPNGGTVGNASSGTITGAYFGVRVSGAGASVTNLGSIFSTATSTGIRGFDAAGVDLADGGTVVNDPSGNIRATWKGVEIGAVGTSIGGTLLNQGAIDASNSAGSTGAAVWIHGPGLISNAATGTIAGGPYGIVAYYQTTVVNLGSIGGTKYAFDAANPGFADRVIVAPGATFSGLVSGGNTIGASVVSTLELASGASAGTLNGLGSKYIEFASVTIDTGAIWTWVSDAIGAGYRINDAGTLTNTGRLGSSVKLGAGAVLTNAATGTISGGTAAPGVYATAAATVVNAGSIGGTPDAVKFAAGATDLLVIDPGASFSGIVDGGNTIGATSVSTLELASGASAGTLSGLGSKYIDFAQVTIDSGAGWTLSGANTIAAGVTLTELNGASLTDSGALVNDGLISIDPSSLIVASIDGTGTIDIGANSTLTVDGTVSAGETIAFTGTNAVLNILDPTGFAGTIQGQGPSDQVNIARTYVWTGAQDTNFATAANWDDVTDSVNPAPAPPGLLTTAEFLATGGIVTGTGTVAVLQFGSGGLWTLGSGAALTSDTGITVGSGMLTVDGGASIASEGSVDVISGTGARAAAVTVSGTDTTWNSAGSLVVGDAGVGGLAIQGDGTVVSNAGTIADQSGASGSSVNVTGAGSDWRVGGTLLVGDAGDGSLSINAGGTVSGTSLDSAEQSTGNADISVNGTASALTLTGQLTVGDASSADLSIFSGATVTAQNGDIGLNAGGAGVVDIEGTGSRLDILNNLNVGDAGTGVLVMGVGTTLTVVHSFVVGLNGVFQQFGGVLDPTNVVNDGVTNLGNGAKDLADASIENSGSYTVKNGTATMYTPLITDDPNPATDGGSTSGVWQINNLGTLVLNADTVDAGQVVAFTTNGVLEIGQHPSTSGGHHHGDGGGGGGQRVAGVRGADRELQERRSDSVQRADVRLGHGERQCGDAVERGERDGQRAGESGFHLGLWPRRHRGGVCGDADRDRGGGVLRGGDADRDGARRGGGRDAAGRRSGAGAAGRRAGAGDLGRAARGGLRAAGATAKGLAGAGGGRRVRDRAAARGSVPLAGPCGLCGGGIDTGAASDQRQHDRAGAGGAGDVLPCGAGGARRAAGGRNAGGEFFGYAGWLELCEPGGAGQAVPGLRRTDVGGVRLRAADRYRAGTGGGTGVGRTFRAGADRSLIGERRNTLRWSARDLLAAAVSTPPPALRRLRLPDDPPQAAQHLARAAQPRRHIHLAHDRQLVVGPQTHLAAEVAAVARQPAHQTRRIGEGIAAEADHHALRPGLQLLHPRLAAGALQRDHLQQVLHLLRQFAETIGQLGGHRFRFGIRRQRADAAIQPQPHRQVGHIGLRDQHRQPQADVRRPVALLPRGATIAGAKLGHRVLQHLLIQLDADLADVAGLLVA